jgi:hypothetical protein
VRRPALLLAICAELLFGCEGGTISNHSQSCTSTGGLLEGRTVTCSGEARVYSYDAEGERLPLGAVSSGTPLRVTDTVIEPFNESSVFFVDAGEDGTVEGLRYEGPIEPL